MTWDGNDRRQPSNDHDILIRIEEKLESFVDTVEELKKKVGWHDKIIYMGLGGTLLIQLILKWR